MRRYDEQEIVTHFRGLVFDDEYQEYLRFHCRRYSVLLAVIESCARMLSDHIGSPCRRLLDVGPNFLTQYLRDTFPTFSIDSLGFEDHQFKCRDRDIHIEYDLTHTDNEASWPQAEPCDVIVMAEVIEHLPVSPSQVLSFLSRLLKQGGFLVIQTPNACSLPKRLRMLCGQNPYEMIRRESKQNPGHFREYTRQELQTIAVASGFTVHSYFTANYFQGETFGSAVFGRLQWMIPENLRDGSTMCLRKQGQQAETVKVHHFKCFDKIALV